MPWIPARLQCDMERDCSSPVTHIDEKGFAYCHAHGEERKAYCRCRRLTSNEIKTLTAGGTIWYDPKRNTRAALAKAEG